MEATVSVSKGVFLLKNCSSQTKKPNKRASTLFETWFQKEPWYTTYRKNWESVEQNIQELNTRTYKILLNDMVTYIKSFNGERESVAMEGIIPSATLLTGVNQPDHRSLFLALRNKIREEVTPHVAMVYSQDASCVKNLLENVVWQFIHGHQVVDYMDEDLDNSTQNVKCKKLRKNHCTMSTLNMWYSEIYNKNNMSPKKKRQNDTLNSLVVIIPDFERFKSNVLQDFVMIISSYISSIPVVLVFGVATTVSALHKSFPYHVSSKLLIKVFHSHSSPVYMNQVLEDIFLTNKSPFLLSGKAFQLLTDVFLFYDFSVAGLIQSIKYCMMDHYYGDNSKSLCCKPEQLRNAIMKLNAEDLENIRQLPSFRPYLESQHCRDKIKLFEDDEFFRDALFKQINKFHNYLYSFYSCLRLFTTFIKDLPRNVFGKTVREMYTKCTIELVTETPAFKECMQLLNFQSQVRLVESIKEALKVINTTLSNPSPVKPLTLTPTKNNLLRDNALLIHDGLGEGFIKNVRVHLLTFLRHIQNASTEVTYVSNPHTETTEDLNTQNVLGSRYQLKEKLLKAAKLDKIQSEFEIIRSRLIGFLEEVFTKGLQPPSTQPFHEIYFFNDVANVKKQIVGSPRGAVHTALCNPEHYLQCQCCRLPSTESIVATLPDLSVAYKLHRECGRHINLYDWLQAFAAVLVPPATDDEEDERRDIDTHIQVRFTRAVAELQFLGFIKSSKRKTDHVMRLTW